MVEQQRRDFLKTCASSTLAAVAAGQAATVSAAPQKDLVTIGCLGTGGRCRRLMQRAIKLKNVKIVAICDIWDSALQRAKDIVGGNVATYTDYRKVLDRKDIDAVIIGSPDHWHVPMTVDACKAGKDVYVEKPLTHSLEEGAGVIAAQNDHQRIVQVGTQQRSMPHLQEAREILESGALGDIFKIHLTWNRNAGWQPNHDFQSRVKNITLDKSQWKQFLGNAPSQEFNPYRFRNWRWFWDFGGGIFTDLMVHWIDTAYWLLDMDNPKTAASMGDHFRTAGLWETPDSVQTLLHYPNNKLQAYFDGTFVNHHNRAMLLIMGANANLYMDRGRYELVPQRHSKVKSRERIDGKGIKGADFYAEVDGASYHLQNWVDCIRSREKPTCPAEQGVRSAAAAHLANLSIRSGSVAQWRSQS